MALPDDFDSWISMCNVGVSSVAVTILKVSELGSMRSFSYFVFDGTSWAEVEVRSVNSRACLRRQSFNSTSPHGSRLGRRIEQKIMPN